MIIDCISDLHGYYPKLDGGDLLIIAGDLTAGHTGAEHFEFNEWLEKQKYRKIVLIAGNHDTWIEKVGISGYGGEFHWKNFEYLCDSGTEFENLRIWGSPWSLKFKGMNPHCMAFTCDTEDELASKFSLIPDDVDILITHSPVYGVLDLTCNGENAGSKSLRRLMSRVHPKLWVTAHIHEAYGQFKDETLSGKRYHFVNPSHVNEHYRPVNKPVRIVL